MRLSIIIPVKFEKRIQRTPKRLFSCLKSLNSQYQDEKDYEVIVSDLGSEKEFLEEIRNIKVYDNCYLTENKGNRYWNRSKALNNGIKVAKGEFIGATDLDMIFAPNFIKTVKKRMKSKVLLQCHCKFLLQDFGEVITPEMIPKFEKAYALAQDYSAGGFQCAERNWFLEHPYDEDFKVWGGEDTLARDIMVEEGFTIDWIDNETSMYHLKHTHYLDVISEDERKFRGKNESLWMTKLWLYKVNKQRGFKEVKY